MLADTTELFSLFLLFWKNLEALTDYTIF